MIMSRQTVERFNSLQLLPANLGIELFAKRLRQDSPHHVTVAPHCVALSPRCVGEPLLHSPPPLRRQSDQAEGEEEAMNRATRHGSLYCAIVPRGQEFILHHRIAGWPS